MRIFLAFYLSLLTTQTKLSIFSDFAEASIHQCNYNSVSINAVVIGFTKILTPGIPPTPRQNNTNL